MKHRITSKDRITAGVKEQDPLFRAGMVDRDGKRYKDIHQLVGAGYDAFWERRGMRREKVAIVHQELNIKEV